MTRRSAGMAVAALVALCPVALLSAASAATTARPPGGTAAASGNWGNAHEAPGTAALNKGGNAQVTSVSCASAGNCAAGGFYADGSVAGQAFVGSEKNGAWSAAEQVPGTGALNKGASAQVTSVSCASAGNCAAGGYYLDSSSRFQVFVLTETNGAWGTAKEIAGAFLHRYGGWVAAMSCRSAGNCSAGGYYFTAGNGGRQAFVVTEQKGAWGTAQQVPGTANRNATITSLSCGSAGNCSAGGSYTGSSGHGVVPFVVSQANGTWGTAEQVRGTAGPSSGGAGGVTSVSCASAGNCSAGGSYTDSSGHDQAFVVAEQKGTWGTAGQVRGTASLNAGITSVSCASAGNCSAGGNEAGSSGQEQVFVVSEQNGTWGAAAQLPGMAALGASAAYLFSLSCGAAGNCGAGGYYIGSGGMAQAYVASETNGTWGSAEQVPGITTLDQGGASTGIRSVSCTAASSCSAGGGYTDSSGDQHAFVVGRS